LLSVSGLDQGISMSELKVALLQMTACGDDQAANQAKGESFCRRAKDLGADLALFPELWNIGYTCEGLTPPPGQ
jgi:predicted amidohydrolase